MRPGLMLACWFLHQADSIKSQHGSVSEERRLAEGEGSLACLCITWASRWWCRGPRSCLPRQPLELG